MTHHAQSFKRIIKLILCASALLPLSKAADVDVLLYSAQASDVSIDVEKTNGYLNEMLQQSAGYEGSSSSSFSQRGVNSLVEAIHDPKYRNTTITQISGNYDYVVFVPSSLTFYGKAISVKEFPELVFEASYQMSRYVLNAGAHPILLMGDPETQANAAKAGENTYRIANGCGISANPAGYAIADQGLAGASTTTTLNQQAYLVAASLYSQITGLNAADLSYTPVTDSQALADAAFNNLQFHSTATHYTTSVHNEGMMRYRYLDLNAGPMKGTARYYRKGSSTELKIKNRLDNILEASGFIAYSKRSSEDADGTKAWTESDFDIVKPEFDSAPNEWFLCYARSTEYAIAPMIAYNQSNLIGLTYDKQYAGMPLGKDSTEWTLSHLHSSAYDMYWEYDNFQWSTIPLHVGIARFYEEDPSLVVSTDGTHLTPQLSYLGASMMGASALGQTLTPPDDLNEGEARGFRIGAQLLKQLAYLSEDEQFTPDSQLAVQDTTLPQASRNSNYTHTLTATGGKSPYTWEQISDETLPEGLTLSANGTITGIPTPEAGITQLVFKVTDANGSIRKQPLKLEVVDSGSAFQPLLHWKLDDGSGMTATAATGTSIDGTLMNAPTWSGYGVDQGSLTFDGDDDYVTSTIPAQPFTAFTLSFWAKSTASGQNKYASVFSHDAESNDFQIDLGGSNGAFQYRGSQAATIGDAVVGEWVHLAVSCDGTDTYLYYNGAYVRTLSGVADNSFSKLLLGVNRAGNQFFRGCIDDVRLYPGELTAAEITSLYQSYPTPSEDPWIEWGNGHFTEAEIEAGLAAPDQDPDMDGIENFLEYAFNLDPKANSHTLGTPGHVSLPVLDCSSKPGSVLFIYRRNLAASDLTYLVEFSKDLTAGSWTAASTSESVLSDDGETQVIQATIQDTLGDKVFLRLNVSQ